MTGVAAPGRPSWVAIPPGSGFGTAHLPYGVFEPVGGGPARCGIRIGDHVLDLSAVADLHRDDFARPSLNAFMARGPAAWADVRAQVGDLVTDVASRRLVEPHLLALGAVRLRLPWDVADYVDFYSSKDHALNVGAILRPGAPGLPAAWTHLPIGYHGRAGTVVVSGTPVVRPCGQFLPPGSLTPVYGPSRRLDIEAEVGFVVGVPSVQGDRVGVQALAEHVFGVVLVNDWSARDLQAWEYQPLGPFLAKSFATSVSAWITPLSALAAAWVSPPDQEPEVLEYLGGDSRGLDLSLEVCLAGETISRPPFRSMYWTPAQQLAHLTGNGASLRTGDLYASGTVSGPARDQRGCLLELCWGGSEPITLRSGRRVTFLEDGDTVVVSATAPGVNGDVVGLGPVGGTVRPARG